ncbi:MAG: DUF2281 domain-containing protein [Nanoarchaeota archaeon]
MQQEQISLEQLAKRVNYLELELNKLKQEKKLKYDDIDWDWSEEDLMLVSQDSLAKEWLSPEEDEAWKDL